MHANRALFLVIPSSLNQGRTASRRPFLLGIRLIFLSVAYGYSTDFVGFIVERISGKSLDQYFKDHIFSPLSITSASFYLTSDLKERLLPLYVRNSQDELEKWNNQVEIIINQDPEKSRTASVCFQDFYLAILNSEHPLRGSGTVFVAEGLPRHFTPLVADQRWQRGESHPLCGLSRDSLRANAQRVRGDFPGQEAGAIQHGAD